ncbi:MAG: glycosyltransferase family 1 protein [Actinobacteria bacterium]|nr:glycosyltransferase family 1 protein [Actinomycetota bacterium]
MCSSTATVNDLRDLGFSEERLRYVPLGVRQTHVTDDDRARVREKLSLPQEYLLFVGTLEPRKNLERLVAALAMDSTLPPLVVAGLDGWGEMGNVSGSDVHFVGYVDEWNLPALYDQASALCYPSLWEGFGLPILEAMSHGTPVVTSRGTSTEEVAGGAAVLVDPTNVDDILRGVREALNSRTELTSRGRSRAAGRRGRTRHAQLLRCMTRCSHDVDRRREHAVVRTRRGWRERGVLRAPTARTRGTLRSL